MRGRNRYQVPTAQPTRPDGMALNRCVAGLRDTKTEIIASICIFFLDKSPNPFVLREME